MNWTPPIQKFLSQDEINNLLSVAENNSIVDKAKGRITWIKRYMLLNLLFKTGLRVFEVANLQIKHLNLHVKEPAIFVEHGKGAKERWVYVPKDLVKHLKQFLTFKKQIGEGVEADNYLFCNKQAGKLSTRALQKSFKSCLLVAGLDTIKYSIHSARHSYASLLYKKSLDLRLTQNQLGHSTPTITALYANLSKSDICEKINSAFG
jgi:site-specific recombinase XerD